MATFSVLTLCDTVSDFRPSQILYPSPYHHHHSAQAPTLVRFPAEVVDFHAFQQRDQTRLPQSSSAAWLP